MYRACRIRILVAVDKPDSNLRHSLKYINRGHSLKQAPKRYIDGLAQDCNDPIANALKSLQSCTKPSICYC